MTMTEHRILVVEDEAIVALDIARALRARGYALVDIVNSAAAAIETARTQRPHLVLMDIRLQGESDGIEAARQIERDLGVPVIFLTAHADENTIERAKEAKPYGYLLKPFEDTELITGVELALSKHRAETASQERAAEILRQSEERFRLLVESLPDYAVFLLDRDGNIRSSNRAAEQIYGYPGDMFTGRPFSLLHSLRASAQQKPDEVLARATVSDSTHDEDWHRRKDGTEFWADALTTALRNNNRELIGFACIVRDMTESKRTKEAIQEANATLESRVQERTRELADLNAELEAFTYSVAHDLRAPLRGIEGYLEAVLDDHGEKLPPDAREMATRAVACTARMQQLVSDLLKLSKIGRQELHFTATPLRSLVDDAIGELPDDTRKRDIEWRIGSLPTANVDPGLMRQVFTNLISNAVKYTRRVPRAVIEVNAVEMNSEPVIVVRDNGVGFDMEGAGRLFTPFVRLHQGPEFEGTGIGLATTGRIVHRHGGRIWAEGRPDQGASFFFTLGQRVQSPVPRGGSRSVSTA
jgi:PAS domain S-box-containing protein